VHGVQELQQARVMHDIVQSCTCACKCPLCNLYTTCMYAVYRAQLNTR